MPVLAQLLEAFPDDIRVIYRHFPLPSHDKAGLATQASEAAHLQDAFWEMSEALYENQAEWSSLSVENFQTWIFLKAEEIGLDMVKFEADYLSDEVITIAGTTFLNAMEMNVEYTPFFIMDNFKFETGYLNVELFADVFIPFANMKSIMFNECPEVTIDPELNYTATIVTDKGDIVIGLIPEVAPFAVNSFIFLAENDFYDDVPFHRVLEGFMAQGGDPSATGMGHPGYYYSLEVSQDLGFDREGLLAMANSGPTSNGSQFFITYAAQPHLNGNYTIFGEVLEGMDVLRSLSLQDPDNPAGNGEPDYIFDVIIEVSE